MPIIQEVGLNIPESILNGVTSIDDESQEVNLVGGIRSLNHESVFKTSAKSAEDSSTKLLIVFGVIHWLVITRPRFRFDHPRSKGGLIHIDHWGARLNDVAKQLCEDFPLIEDALTIGHCLTIDGLTRSKCDAIVDIETPERIGTYS